MKIKVQLEGEEFVEDWSEFRDVFTDAAKRIGLDVSTIIHTNQELT